MSFPFAAVDFPVEAVALVEEVKRKGKASIEKWIDDNMYGKSCVVVLVGSETANRPWVIRERNGSPRS